MVVPAWATLRARPGLARLPRTIPATISISEGMDIGEDVGSAVDFTYKPPFKFTGKIDKVMFDLK